MSYAIADVDVREPLPTVQLAADQTGVAVLLRASGRPIGFFLQGFPPNTVLSQDELAPVISRHAGVAILRASLEEELGASTAAAPPVDLTVAVCTRDRHHLLRECLDSLLQQRESRPFRLLVVDNAPSDGQTRDVVAGLAGVDYVCEPRPGLDFARNRALGETKTEFIAYVDDDVVVDRGWLAGLDAAVHAYPDLGGVTGQVLPFELETEAQIQFERHCSFRRGFQQVRYIGQQREGNALYPAGPGMFGAGCNMALRCRVLRELDGFDEALDTGPPLPGGGDLDIFYRLIRSGHALVYEPRFLAFHRHRRDHRGLRRQYWSWGSGYMAFWHKAYRYDPELRPKLRKMLVWWLADEVRQLRGTFREGRTVSPDVVMAQLAGGILTVAWKYPWSRRRSARITQDLA